jgi:hypothetical protein
VEALVRTATAEHVAFTSARLAGHIGRGEIPSPKELFLLSAAVVEGARREDLTAIKLAFDSVAGLLDSVPHEDAWDACRGHLRAIMGFAWLLWGRGETTISGANADGRKRG